MVVHLTGDLAAELITRISVTAVIVIGITIAVERLGPKIGGALAGLPIVVGPAFFFIMREHGAAFTAEMAGASLLSLCAIEAFLLAYSAVAFRTGPTLAIVAATLTWLFFALILSPIPPRPKLALLLFIMAALVARRLGRTFLRPAMSYSVPGGYLLLLVRGLTAGLLVAVATLAAAPIGSGWSGFIVTYPVGFSVISTTIHQRLGAATVIATLNAAMVGVASLAAFSLTLSLSIEAIGSALAFAGALTASTAVTALLTWQSTMVAQK